MVDRITDDPVVAIATPRPDFDGAVTEFLIGLMTAALLPETEEEWRALWLQPPSESVLQARLEALPNAFDLDGSGPRFLQDQSVADFADVDVDPIQDLLVNAKNSGLFIKPGVVNRMGRPAAAMALITMQAYSTAGGRGFRTSVRGGGPLTTLVDPRRLDEAESTLWQLVWANVETMAQLKARGDTSTDRVSDTYPWMGVTRTSEAKGASTTSVDAHPLQAYFGMPRRIRLEFANQSGACDITGQDDTDVAIGFRGRPYGVNYERWHHPLSPYYAGKEPNELLPVHGQPGGVGWRDWLGLLHGGSAAPGKAPALTVANFGAKRAQRIGRARHSLRIFGYDASNAKIRAWISSVLPAFAESDPDRLAAIDAAVRALVDATERAGYVLQQSVATALHARADDAPGDLTYIKAALWNATQDWFYRELDQLVTGGEIAFAAIDLKRRYRHLLTTETLRVFDELVPGDATSADLLRRIVRARFGLFTTLHGGGNIGQQIFAALGEVTSVEKAKRRKQSVKSKAGESE